jgi:hypothetical protein
MPSAHGSMRLTEFRFSIPAGRGIGRPTLAAFPPKLADFESIDGNGRKMEINLAGVPALAQPIATCRHVPIGSAVAL